jgi:ATP-dependent Clp protease ATP-binding subunit ClpA
MLTNEHLCLAYAQVEWDMFGQLMQDLKVNPHEVLYALEEHMRALPAAPGRELEVAPATRLLFRLALVNASRSGRQAVESTDLFAAVFEETQGVPGSIIRRYGVDPETLVSRLASRLRDHEQRDERLKKRFELPPFLKHFATNLNHLARQDKVPPLFGRDAEMTQVFEILCHRERANSVLLLGEPGVGKTAIAEGLARLIEFEPHRVPARLRGCQIVNLQMNNIVAGTMLRGMFEDRIQNVIREIKERPNLILFVDEVHTMIGAGSALGAPADAANMFKSVLARGEVRIIGATTLSEYKEFIQEDEALARRFRTVRVAEPTIEETRRILYGLRPRLERNYSVRIRDEAIETALAMSPRYMRHLQLPDKVIGWLDTAAVRAEISRRVDVTGNDVVNVISTVSRIPEDMVFRDVTDRFRDVELQLGSRVVGQSQAIGAVARRLVLNKGPLKDGFDRPDGVLLFLGPTGVGKTELAKSVAHFLFGDEKRMIRIDMSEYQDGGVGVDKMIGMPRGIVGSERGGVLTNQLKDHPYSVVLLDEVEKASPAMLNLFLQAFDEGWLTDGRGKRVYLSDAIVIMTSNIGSEFFRRLTNPLGFLAQQRGVEQIQGDVLREVERRFTPEFRNRIDEVVIFQPLSKEEVRTIALLQIDRINQSLAGSRRTLHVTPSALELLVNEGYSLAYGARFLKRTIEACIKLPISQRWNDGRRFTATVHEGRIAIEVAPPSLAATA